MRLLKTFAAGLFALLLAVQPCAAQMLLMGVGSRTIIAPTTWNPSDKSANITLSGSNLTATDTATDTRALVRATTSKTSGKWHFEATLVSGTVSPGIGVANATASLTAYLGVDNNGIGWFCTGSVNRNGGQQGVVDSYAATDILAVEVDLDNHLIYFQKNGGSRSSGFDISAITGALFPTFSGYDLNSAMTANFGHTAFTITPTSGYSAWGT